jgi:hypothetical protein
LIAAILCGKRKGERKRKGEKKRGVGERERKEEGGGRLKDHFSYQISLVFFILNLLICKIP